MEKGVYIFGNQWKNANDNLDIRGYTNDRNTINNAPTNKGVPKVFAYNGQIFEQIYPAKDIESGRITLVSKDLNQYRYRPDLARRKPGPWGWHSEGDSAQGFYGVDTFQHGGDDMSDVHRICAGWLDLGSRARNMLPNAKNVKQIKYLSFTIKRKQGAGHHSDPCKMFLNLNRIDGTIVNGDKNANCPHTNLIGSPVCIGTLDAASKRYPSTSTIVVNLGTTQGQQVANLIMSWMRGEGGATSLVQYSGETKGVRYPPWGTWSRNYTRVIGFSMTIEYVSEGV